MISVRERIVREVVSRCQAAVAPATVLRQPTVAVTREQTPALVVMVESDEPVRRFNDRMERELRLRLVALARDSGDGYAVADDLICRAHMALFEDAILGGLAVSLAEDAVDYQAEDADIDAIAIPAAYRIAYRTFVSDISQQG